MLNQDSIIQSLQKNVRNKQQPRQFDSGWCHQDLSNDKFDKSLSMNMLSSLSSNLKRYQFSYKNNKKFLLKKPSKSIRLTNLNKSNSINIQPSNPKLSIQLQQNKQSHKHSIIMNETTIYDKNEENDEKCLNQLKNSNRFHKMFQVLKQYNQINASILPLKPTKNKKILTFLKSKHQQTHFYQKNNPIKHKKQINIQINPINEQDFKFKKQASSLNINWKNPLNSSKSNKNSKFRQNISYFSSNNFLIPSSSKSYKKQRTKQTRTQQNQNQQQFLAFLKVRKDKKHSKTIDNHENNVQVLSLLQLPSIKRNNTLRSLTKQNLKQKQLIIINENKPNTSIQKLNYNKDNHDRHDKQNKKLYNRQNITLKPNKQQFKAKQQFLKSKQQCLKSNQQLLKSKQQSVHEIDKFSDSKIFVKRTALAQINNNKYQYNRNK